MDNTGKIIVGLGSLLVSIGLIKGISREKYDFPDEEIPDFNPGETYTPEITPEGDNNQTGDDYPSVVPGVDGEIVTPGYWVYRVQWEMSEGGETYSDVVSWEEACENGWVDADGNLVGNGDSAFSWSLIKVWVPPVTQI